ANGSEAKDYVDAIRAAYQKIARGILDWTTETLASAPALDAAPEDGATTDALPEDVPDNFGDAPLPPEPDAPDQ
ncbi:MAG: hypothetical protein AAGF09_06780, partial [Pseudomonadota bacterium]